MNYLVSAINAANGSNGMDVIHWQMNILGRKTGSASGKAKNSSPRSVALYSAYCAGEKTQDTCSGQNRDWSKRRDVFFTEVILPQNAPTEYGDRKILWSEVEKVEKHKNAQLARQIVIALPNEFSPDIQVQTIREYVQECFVNRGMCADVCLHDNGTGNPHAHVILTTRSLDQDGSWMAKQKKVYRLDSDGNTIYDPIKRQYKCSTVKINNWDDPRNVELWREAWAHICNRAYERLGFKKRVTHLSYKKQGLGLLPMKHLGSQLAAMERRGIRTKLGEQNRTIKCHNIAVVSAKVRQRMKTLVHIITNAMTIWRNENHERLKHLPREHIPTFSASDNRGKQNASQYERKYTRSSTPNPVQGGKSYKNTNQPYERKHIRNHDPMQSFALSLSLS